MKKQRDDKLDILFSEKKYEQAKRLCNKYLMRNISNALPYYYLAKLNTIDGDYDKAVYNFNLSLINGGNNLENLRGISIANLLKGNFEVALEKTFQIANNYSHDVESRLLLSILLIAVNSFRHANKLLDELTIIDPTNEAVHQIKFSLMLQIDVEAAEKYNKMLEEKFHGNKSIVNNRVKLLFKKKDYSGALLLIQNNIKKIPELVNDEILVLLYIEELNKVRELIDEKILNANQKDMSLLLLIKIEILILQKKYVDAINQIDQMIYGKTNDINTLFIANVIIIKATLESYKNSQINVDYYLKFINEYIRNESATYCNEVISLLNKGITERDLSYMNEKYENKDELHIIDYVYFDNSYETILENIDKKITIKNNILSILEGLIKEK